MVALRIPDIVLDNEVLSTFRALPSRVEVSVRESTPQIRRIFDKYPSITPYDFYSLLIDDGLRYESAQKSIFPNVEIVKPIISELFGSDKLPFNLAMILGEVGKARELINVGMYSIKDLSPSFERLEVYDPNNHDEPFALRLLTVRTRLAARDTLEEEDKRVTLYRATNPDILESNVHDNFSAIGRLNWVKLV